MMNKSPFSRTQGKDTAAIAMRTKRPISINNSLCHGICNYNCSLCGVNKPQYTGPTEYQSKHVTEMLVERVKEAARSGVRIRIVANAGDGEPTLHPDFRHRMKLFGDMIRSWDAPVPAPEISIVTNGSHLLDPEVTAALTENPITVNVSFPTSDPENYGKLMFCDADKGQNLLEKAIPGIKRMMKLKAEGKLSQMHFHVSPPDREIVRRDFPQTVEVLTGMAQEVGLDEVSFVMFAGTSNRSGLIRNKIKTWDGYKDFFRSYKGRRVNGVRVRMTTVLKRFFPRFSEILDMIRAYDYPCIWNGNFLLTAAGDSICCNDQAVRSPMGDILTHSIKELMVLKERYTPSRACAGCDATPFKMKGTAVAAVLNLGGRARYALTCARADRERKPALSMNAN